MGRPMRAIRDPRNLYGTRAVTPHVQLAEQYGGKAALRQALEEARQRIAPSNTNAVGFVDPSLREYFPEVDYDNYDRVLDVGPHPEMADTNAGQLVWIMPEDAIGGQAQLMTGDFASVGDLQDPLIITDPFMPDVGEWAEAAGLPPEGDTAARAARQMGVENPMSELVLDDVDYPTGPEASIRAQLGIDGPRQYDLAPESELGFLSNVSGQEMGFDPKYGTPAEIDKTLMAIRRASGKTDLSLEEATQLIQDAANRGAQSTMGGLPVSSQGMNIDPQTGTLVEQLLALNYMPANVRRFLPMRMRELFGLGGVGAGMGLSNEGDQSIDPRSTMGPDVLGGLRQ